MISNAEKIDQTPKPRLVKMTFQFRLTVIRSYLFWVVIPVLCADLFLGTFALLVHEPFPLSDLIGTTTILLIGYTAYFLFLYRKDIEEPIKLLKNGNIVKAHLISLEQKRFFNKRLIGSYRGTQIIYRFTDSGGKSVTHTQTINLDACFGDCMDDDDNIIIAYLPENPQKSAIFVPKMFSFTTILDREKK